MNLVWEIIKALEQIKDSIASKYFIFIDSLSCLQALQYMKLEHPLIGVLIRKCVFFTFANKVIIFCLVSGRVGVGGKTLLPSLLWICLVSRLGYSILVLNIMLTGILFPIGKMIGMVRSRTSFLSVGPVLVDWRSSYRRCRKDEVVLCRARIGHTHLTHSYILHLSVSTVSVF